jgi:hypothetical protein
MQQGLAFYQRLLLLKVLEIFNSGVYHERTVFYAPNCWGIQENPSPSKR